MIKSVRKYKLGEEPNDLEFWLTKTPQERLARLELLRKNYIVLNQIIPGVIKVIAIRKLGE
jgi:hypothetical protein